jgi:hypothetical protein
MTFATADEIQQCRVLFDFLHIFATCRPLRKNPMLIIQMKDFCEKNSIILPDFEGTEIMKSPYLNNKFQQAQRKQDSFYKKVSFLSDL